MNKDEFYFLLFILNVHQESSKNFPPFPTNTAIMARNTFRDLN